MVATPVPAHTGAKPGTSPGTGNYPGEDNARLTAWLQAAGGGDQTAFRQLATALAPRLHALAWRLTAGGAGGQMAEDIMQEVLIKLWQAAPRWQAGGAVTAYVSRLVYTTAMDAHRRNHHAGLQEVSLESGGSRDEEGETTALEIPTPETVTARIHNRQQRQWLLEGIKKLPERQQEAVVLSYFHDHHQKAVAQALGTTEKAVESLLVRARRTLAETLGTPLNPSTPETMNNGGFAQ